MNTIICAAYNNWELTKMTYDSMLATTEQPYRAIFINNGSTDKTEEWLGSVDGTVTKITSPINGGCGIGRNIGMRLVQSDSDYITLIDNDIVLTKGWDTEMIKFMDANPQIGICGPSTNFAGTPQLLDKKVYKLPTKLDEVEPFAQWYKDTHRGQAMMVPPGFVVIGFVMMIRKACYDALKYPDGSLFDEQFKLYGKEDNDLCVRASRAGWKMAYFRGCYVHHWGSKSLAVLGDAGYKQWDENNKAFEKKWGFK